PLCSSVSYYILLKRHAAKLLQGSWVDEYPVRSFEQEISRIPVTVRNLSTLELQIATQGESGTEHVYGAMLLDLLRLYSSLSKSLR
ncbi:unnamed protein product, partial [Urochloa humidicola]